MRQTTRRSAEIGSPISQTPSPNAQALEDGMPRPESMSWCYPNRSRCSRITMLPRSGYVACLVQGAVLRIASRRRSSQGQICSYKKICSRFRFKHPSSPIARADRIFSTVYVVSSQDSTQNKLGVFNTVNPHTGTQRNHDRPRFGVSSCVTVVAGARGVVGDICAGCNGKEDV